MLFSDCLLNRGGCPRNDLLAVIASDPAECLRRLFRCAPGYVQRIVLRFDMRDRAAIPLVYARFQVRRFVSGDCFVQPLLGLEVLLLDEENLLFSDCSLNKGGCPRNDLESARFQDRLFVLGDCFVQPHLGF